jgi:hypothetical protein
MLRARVDPSRRGRQGVRGAVVVQVAYNGPRVCASCRHHALSAAPLQIVCGGAATGAQWPAKRLLHLLGVLEVEYRPFVRYGPALLATLLEGQGVDPSPFLERKVDAHILLSLEEPYLRSSLGLDDVAAKKVRGWGWAGTMSGRVWPRLDCRPGPTLGARLRLHRCQETSSEPFRFGSVLSGSHVAPGAGAHCHASIRSH